MGPETPDPTFPIMQLAVCMFLQTTDILICTFHKYQFEIEFRLHVYEQTWCETWLPRERPLQLTKPNC